MSDPIHARSQAAQQAIETVMAQGILYFRLKKKHPNVDPHLLLQQIYISRKRMLGDNSNAEDIANKSYYATEIFACLPEPKNIKALALYLLYESHELDNNLYKHFPNYSGRVDALTREIMDLRVSDPQEFKRRYRLYNTD